jgi:hypothetical protein
MLAPRRDRAIARKMRLAVELACQPIVGPVLRAGAPCCDEAEHDLLPSISVVVVVGCQCAVQPPSTGNAVPVIDAAMSLDKNTASAPISSTVANFLFG